MLPESAVPQAEEEGAEEDRQQCLEEEGNQTCRI
jgi:hypothetical protein